MIQRRLSGIILIAFLASLFQGISWTQAETSPAYEPGVNIPSSPNSKLRAEIDEFSGALNYSYPLTLPPGRNSLTPQLSLNYSSLRSSNSSILGYGWDLSIPSIERINRKGSHSLYEENNFSSSMSGELLGVDSEHYVTKVEKGDFFSYERSGNTWVATDKSGTVYRFGLTSLSRQDDPADGSRIFKWMLEDITDSSGNFITYTYTKDNGQIYPSQISYTGHGSEVGDFTVNFTLMEVEAVEDYSSAFAIQTQKVIEKIEVNQGTKVLRSYTLSYSSGHNRHRVVLDSLNETAISAEGVSTSLPSTTFHYQATEDSWTLAEDWLMPYYSADDRLYSYETASSTTGLLDVNGDDLSDFIVMDDVRISGSPADDGYYRVYLNTGSKWELAPDWTMPYGVSGETLISYNFSSSTTEFLDVNGDGLPDFLVMDNTSISGDPTNDFHYRVYLNSGTGWELDESWKMPTACSSCGSTTGYQLFSINSKMMDINGDGLPDFVLMDQVSMDASLTPGYYKVFLNTGEGWELDESWGMPKFVSGTTLMTYDAASDSSQLMDINGDQLPDFVVMKEGTVTGSPENDAQNRVYINTGDAWELAPEWMMPVYTAEGAVHSYSLSSSSTGMLDINGDALPDFVVMDNTSITGSPSNDYKYRVYINTGKSWQFAPDWEMPVSCTSCGFIGYEFNSNISQMMDVNGDDLPDFVLMDETVSSSIPGNYKIFLNTGSSWEEDPTWDLPLFSSGGSVYSYDVSSGISAMLDVNADGLLDFVVMDDTTITGSPSEDYKYRVYLNIGQMADRISSIELSTGASLSVEYGEEPILDRNPFQKTATIYVVSKLHYEDGLGTSRTVTYAYQEGKFYFHPEQYKSFTGFGSVTKTETGKVTKTYTHQGNGEDVLHGEKSDDVSKIGYPYRVEIYDDLGNLYQRQLYDWGVTDLGDGSQFVHQDQEVSMTYDATTSHRDSAITYTYDSYGNVKSVVNYGEVNADADGDFTDLKAVDEKTTTTYSYASDSSGKVRNKVSEELVKNASGSLLKKTRTFYDSLGYGSVSTGNATRVSQWDDVAGAWNNTDYTYNSYGLVSSVKNPRGNSTNFTYDSLNLYPQVTTNAKGYTTTTLYDYASGQITRLTDENGFVRETKYDGLGRPVSVSVPDPASGALTTLSTISYDDDSVPSSVSTTTTVSGVTSKTVSYLDGYGRTVETNTLAEDSAWNTVDVWYDELGNVAQQTFPYSSGSAFGRDDSQASVITTYDALNRPLTVTSPTGSTEYNYSQWKTTITDPNGHDKIYSYDSAGDLLQVDEKNGSSTYSTVYTYDALRELTALKDAQGNLRHFDYDSLGRKLSQEDLHKSSESSFGTYTYTYDKNNNLLTQKDPKSQTITWAYDTLDRVTSEDWDSATPAKEVSYTYDTATHGKMKVAKVTSNLGDTNVTYTYDALGDVSQETRAIKKPGLSTFYTYTFQTTSDLLDRPTKIVYPSSALTVNYTYNETGKVEKVTRGTSSPINVVSDIDYTPAGQVSQMTYLNGVTISNTYDPAKDYRLTKKVTTGRYSTTLSGAPVSNIQDLTYSYDANGNITGIVDASSTPTKKTLSYTYDDLNRLKSATSSGFASGDYSESYAYDSVGNITSKSGVGTLSYSGTGAGGKNPHAVTSVGSATYSYDLNGNLTSDGTHSYVWDKRNRLASSGALAYSYDASGSRYKTVDSTSGTPSYTYYVSRYEELRGGTATSAGTPTYYIFAGDQRVAALENLSYSYYSDDHLGGTTLTTNAGGYVTQIYDYYPYGTEALNTKLSTTDARHSFTDKELEDSLGLYYFEARWYNPTIGRFVSQDPLDGMSYTYAIDNPIRIVDPTGLYNLQAGKVEEGDTLGEITNQLNEWYGTDYTYKDIAQINGISDPDHISINQTVIIGTIDENGSTWTPPSDPGVIDETYWSGLTSDQQKLLHYSRNLYEGNLPSNNDQLGDEWINYGNTGTHNLNGASGNTDYRTSSGQQAVYNSKGELVNNPENMGTYDFSSPSVDPLSHASMDVNPWVQWGNSAQDTTTSSERYDSTPWSYKAYNFLFN